MMTTQPLPPSALVLIVEDHQPTRALYRALLSHSGFRTADAHNGHQALEMARSLLPNAIVTDVALPDMDGFELCRALKEAAETRAIPILAVTGHIDYLDDPDRFRVAGIDQVLAKPCAPDLNVRPILNRTGIVGGLFP